MDVFGYFITGTDTGVGKTFVTCLLARLARARGQRVFAFKPIETGCEGLGEDQRALVEAAGGWQQGLLQGCYQFKQPAAPSVAATTPIDFALIKNTFAQGSAGADLSLVEGAGGWCVPITETEDMASLCAQLDLPVIIVARAGLGTINHTLLTARAVGSALRLIVMSVRPEDDRDFAESNRREIGKRTTAPILFSDESDALARFVVRS